MELLLSPLSWILVTGLWLPLAIRTRRQRQLSFACCVLLGVAGLLGAMPLGANLLVGTLERGADQATGCTMAAPATIVVLAGGADRAAAGVSDFKMLNLASLRRVVAAVALSRAQSGRALIFSGGSAFPGAPAESALMESFADALGVPPGTTRVETMSTTTWESALSVAALLPPPRRIWLATSALHMRRARFAFAHAGFDVCPYPTDSRAVAFGLPGSLLPQAGAAMKSEQALHEWVGLAYYQWLAWRGG